MICESSAWSSCCSLSVLPRASPTSSADTECGSCNDSLSNCSLPTLILDLRRLAQKCVHGRTLLRMSQQCMCIFSSHLACFGAFVLIYAVLFVRAMSCPCMPTYACARNYTGAVSVVSVFVSFCTCACVCALFAQRALAQPCFVAQSFSHASYFRILHNTAPDSSGPTRTSAHSMCVCHDPFSNGVAF